MKTERHVCPKRHAVHSSPNSAWRSVHTGGWRKKAKKREWRGCRERARESKEPACTDSGCEAGTYCPDCEKYVNGGQEIGATGHNYTTACDTVCSVCGEDNGQTPAHEYDVRNVCIHCGYSADTGNVSGEESLETSVSDSEDSKNNDISDSNSESNQTEDDGSLIRWVIPTAAVTILVIGVTVFLITSKKKNK